MRSASVCWLLGNAGLFTRWDSYWIHHAEAEREHVEQTPVQTQRELLLTEILPLTVAIPDLCSLLHPAQFSEKGFCLTCPF